MLRRVDLKITLKMQTARSSETSVNFKQTTSVNIQVDKSYSIIFLFVTAFNLLAGPIQPWIKNTDKPSSR
jgi:hypothetical protein